MIQGLSKARMKVAIILTMVALMAAAPAASGLTQNEFNQVNAFVNNQANLQVLQQNQITQLQIANLRRRPGFRRLSSRQKRTRINQLSQSGALATTLILQSARNFLNALQSQVSASPAIQ
jgi:hypothetical protein